MDRRTKGLLERAKEKLERKLGRRLTWNEFFENVVKMFNVESILELNNEEAEIIKELTIEGRRSWKRSA